MTSAGGGARGDTGARERAASGRKGDSPVQLKRQRECREGEKHAAAEQGHPVAIETDTHCHLGFLADPAAYAREVANRGVQCLSATVEPTEHARLASALEGCRSVAVGLGLHPWWVAADNAARGAQLEAFERSARNAPLISEVGLDFGPAHEDARAAQEEAFRHICALCAKPLPCGGKRALSIHAVRSAGTVLDILEETGALGACACVFHWFSGTSDELTRARRAGCLFSINERMLATKRGRAYARAIPADRLLLETDLPSRPGEPLSPTGQEHALRAALRTLATLRNDPDLPQRIAQNAASLHVLRGFSDRA